MRVRKSILIILLTLLLSVSKDIRATDGIWFNEELQFYLDIEDGIYKRYQVTKLSCFSGSAGFLPSVGTINNNKIDDYYDINQSSEKLELSRPQEPIKLTLKKVKRMPYSCKGMPVDTVLSNFYIFWQSIAEIYSFSHLSREQWKTVLTENLSIFVDLDLRLFEDKELEDLTTFERFSDFIYEIGDPHIFLIAPKIQKIAFGDEKISVFPERYINSKIREKYINKQRKRLADSQVSFANNNIIVATKGDLLYINVISLSGYSPHGQYTDTSDAALNEAILFIKTIINSNKDVLFDLRFNEGGSVSYANKLSSLFSESTQNVAFIKKDDNNYEALSFNNNSGTAPRSLLVLTSKYTASAAELLTLNLKAAGAKIIGENTRGAFSPVVLKTLPNGWMLGIPPFSVVDNKYNPVPHRIGISPDIKLLWDDKKYVELSDWEAWRQALALKNNQPPSTQ